MAERAHAEDSTTGRVPVTKPHHIDPADLAHVTGGLVSGDGGCVRPNPFVDRFLESLKKLPPPNGLPTQLGPFGPRQPK